LAEKVCLSKLRTVRVLSNSTSENPSY